MQIERIDPGDEAALRPWFAAYEAAYGHDWPGEPGWLFTELQGALPGLPGVSRSLVLAAGDDGRLVGTAVLTFSLKDNPQIAELGLLTVVPDRRRRGIGSALVAEAERLVRAEGRSVVSAMGDERPGVAGGWPGHAFALDRGYRVVQAELRRDLALPVDRGLLDRLEAECRPHVAGYELVELEGTYPDDYVEDRALLGRRMSTDAPLGERDRDEETWDADRVRRVDELIAAMDRTRLIVGALAPGSRRMVAFSELTVPNALPVRAYQWDTLVLAEHRGHRLGMLLKLANIQRVAARFPETRTISTWNAAENEPMIAVNEALGFTVAATGFAWEKHLEP